MKNLKGIHIVTIIVAIAVFGMLIYVDKNNNFVKNENVNNYESAMQQSNALKNNELINKQEKFNEYKNVYSITNKDFNLYGEPSLGEEKEYRGIKLFELDTTNKEYDVIYYILYDYGTEPSLEYYLEITDELDKSLLIEKEEVICGGMVSSAKIKKIGLDKKINVSVIEKSNDEIICDATVQIDLSQDLEEKKKIDKSESIVERTLGDIKFKCVYDEYEYFGTTSHAYSKKLVGENCSFSLNAQYGNRLKNEEHIEFSYNVNVNELSLEEAFEKLNLITSTVGQYGLSDFYGMDIFDKKGNHQKTVVITFEEMIDLCNGKTIEKDGEKYTKDSFETYAEISLKKDSIVEIGNRIQALKYNYNVEDSADYYMFIYNNNIYNIRVPKAERISDDVKIFLNSLDLIK